MIPAGLIESQFAFAGAAGRRFIARLPALIDDVIDRWRLTVTGAPMHGMAALILPVRSTDGTVAVVKFQVLDEETAGEPVALDLWRGRGAARVLQYDPSTGTMLLERLGEPMSAAIERRRITAREGVVVIAELLARLTAMRAPAEIRRLRDVAQQILDRLAQALKRVNDVANRRLLGACGRAVAEVVDQAGDRLLHWDLHFENVLAARHEPWLAIDPKPLAGDPGFDLFPAIDNLFDPADVLWRFDAMTEIIGLDRQRAKAWTLARVLQNALWDISERRPLADDHLDLARQLLTRR